MAVVSVESLDETERARWTLDAARGAHGHETEPRTVAESDAEVCESAAARVMSLSHVCVRAATRGPHVKTTKSTYKRVIRLTLSVSGPGSRSALGCSPLLSPSSSLSSLFDMEGYNL